MTYRKIVGSIPEEKREKISVKLVDIILKSKNDDKMPGSLAKEILHCWHQGSFLRENSLAPLFEAAVLLEPDKTIDLLEQELQLVDLAKAVKQTAMKR
jgi:hypothetical protein